MKQLTIFNFILSFYFFSASTLTAQTGPCLRVSPEVWTTCPAQAVLDATTLTPNLVRFDVMEPTADLESNPGARYKAFWMFGDGNFKWNPYGTPEQDLATMGLTYLYENEGNYSPVVVLSERKSNSRPPKKPKRNLNVQGMTAPIPTGGNFVPQIPSGKSMNIFNHDYNRPHYPTVFVVSAKPNSGLSHLYLFYNSKPNGRGGYEHVIIHDQLEDVFLPNYLPSSLSRNILTTAAATWPSQLTELQTILGSRFANFLVVSAENGWSARRAESEGQKGQDSPKPTQLPAEIRIFPSFLSQWDPAWIDTTTKDTLLPKGHYLALAVGTTPHPSLDPNQSNTNNPLVQEVRQYFPNLNTSTLQCGTGAYIQGIATADVDMVASIDPNGLTILEICPLAGGNFKVKIRMEVCNEGYMHEKNFAFKLIDHTGNISRPNFISGQAPLFQNANGNTWNYIWEVFLDGVPLPTETTESRGREPKLCETAEFEVETNWQGVQKLARGEGLELCVQFDHAREECTKNYKVDEKFCKECGYACASESGCKCQNQCCTVLLICLIAIFVIILLWWILKGRNTGFPAI